MIGSRARSALPAEGHARATASAPEPAPAPDRETHPATPAPPGAAAAAAAVCAAVAAVAVLRHLGTKPLWRDEAISVSVAGRPVTRILSVLPHHDANAGLYYLLLHAWLRIGHSPGWARGFSALCLIATAAVVAWAATRWQGWQAGLACGLLVALNPFLVYYGQEARPYSLAVLLAAVSTAALFGRGQEPARRLYVAATVALVYADLFALLYVAAMAGALVARYRMRGHRLPPVLRRCWWVIAGASAPLAAVMLLFERGQISWLSRPTWRVLVATVTSMGGGWLGLEVMVVLASVAIVGRRPPAAGQRAVVVALAAAAVAPPIALWLVSQVVPSFVDRYVICSALALAVLAGAGLSVVRRVAGRVVALAILAALLLLGSQGTARLEAQRYKVDNAPAVVAFIQAQSRAGDAVVYAGGGLRILVESSLPARAAFPPDIALAPGGESFRQHDLYAREVDAPALTARLAGVQRLWLVTDPSDQSYPQGGPFAVLRPMVMSTFEPGATTTFGAADVTLLVRRR